MRKLVPTLLLITLAAVAWPQAKKIDSINRRIGKATSDTQRINLKVAKLRILGGGNLDTALAFGRSLLADAKKIAYPEGEANTRLCLAGDYTFTGNYTAAKNNLDSAKTILLRGSDTIALGDMYGRYGMMYSMQNKFAIAHTFYNKAIEVIRSKSKKHTLLSTILQNNAIAYQQESNFPMALSNYQQALRITEQLNDIEGAAYIYLNIAITYNSLSENKAAEQFYLKAIATAKKLQLKNVLAYAYANISSLYGDLKKLDEQYDFAMKAAALGEELGDKGIE